MEDLPDWSHRGSRDCKRLFTYLLTPKYRLFISCKSSKLIIVIRGEMSMCLSFSQLRTKVNWTQHHVRLSLLWFYWSNLVYLQIQISVYRTLFSTIIKKILTGCQIKILFFQDFLCRNSYRLKLLCWRWFCFTVSGAKTLWNIKTPEVLFTLHEDAFCNKTLFTLYLKNKLRLFNLWIFSVHWSVLNMHVSPVKIRLFNCFSVQKSKWGKVWV